jgi:DNA primase
MPHVNEVEEVKARLDIVDVIGQYVQLQKAGRSFKAPCPFHSERTPSFIVTPERQSWHCFGACGTGGDVITFVMKKEAIEFPDALKMLAERAGVRLHERRVSEQEDRRRQRLYAANDAAAEWYRYLLLNADAARAARAYLERRGIDEGTAQSFGLGFSPPAWEGLRDHLRERGYSDDELLRTGLLVQGDSGLHDRFRGRLMFPIEDDKGRLAGFGARVLDDTLPKYINTSQTPAYDKSGLLYGLKRATAGIRREGRAVIVEGYMDVIAAHQHGFDNVAASMGTALTERQVRLLRRSAGEIVLALDADAAGRDAAIRGHDVVREALQDTGATVPVVTWRGLAGYQQTVDVQLKVVVLPEGRDPDDVIRAAPEDWRGLVEGAIPVLDFRLDALAASHDLSTPSGRSQLAQEFLPVLAAVTDPVVRAHYLQRLGRLSLTGERELSAMLTPANRRKSARPTAAEPALAPMRGDAREEFLLALLLRYPDLREDALDTPDELLWSSENRALLSAWKNVTADGEVSDQTEAVKSALPVELIPYVERLTFRKLPEYDLKEARKALMDCVQRLERRRLETEKQAIGSLLAEREAEIGASLLAEAAASEEIDDERVLEVVSLQAQDMRTGLRLHGRDNYDGPNAVETGSND